VCEKQQQPMIETTKNTMCYTCFHRGLFSIAKLIILHLLYFEIQDNIWNWFVRAVLQYGDSALHGAARCGHHRILKLLVNANGSTDCLNKVSDPYCHRSAT